MVAEPALAPAQVEQQVALQPGEGVRPLNLVFIIIIVIVIVIIKDMNYHVDKYDKNEVFFVKSLTKCPKRRGGEGPSPPNPSLSYTSHLSKYNLGIYSHMIAYFFSSG